VADFATIRRDLAHAKINLRHIKDDFEKTKAQREHLIIAGMNGTLGKNAEERERNLTIALSGDDEYQGALELLRRAEADIDLIEARLETACDERREHEWRIRGKLADALLGRVQSDDVDLAGDGAFDDSADEVAWQQHAAPYDDGGTYDDSDFPF
jgi:hypothetical protein